jgi:hypothetical protein
MGTDQDESGGGVPASGGVSGGAGERDESGLVLTRALQEEIDDYRENYLDSGVIPDLSLELAQRIVDEAPRKGDPTCPHEPTRQVTDGYGLVCLDCTVIRVVA